ncbi:MAG: glycosyltransferase, partial [Candidatus Jordarchaeales archaeon]
MRLSVIVPTYNSYDSISECINSLLTQKTSREYEVIIVDDGSEDDFLKILEKLTENNEKIKLIKKRHEGPSKARNIGILYAKGDIVVFTDSDCKADPYWLEEIAKTYEMHPEVAGVGGPHLSKNGKTSVEQAVAFFFASPLSGNFSFPYLKAINVKEKKEDVLIVSHLPSCNSSYKKDLLVKIGGFREGLWPGEDVELDYRLKKSFENVTLLFNPKAVVWHNRPKTVKSFLKMIWRYAYVKPVLKKLHPETFSIHIIFPLIAFLFTPLFFFILLICPVFSVMWLVTFGILLTYALLVLFEGLRASVKHRNPKLFFLLPFIIILSHFIWSIGLINGFL